MTMNTNTAKIFATGKSQAARIPKDYCFGADQGKSEKVLAE
jgi:virulence-associated protein VagC